MQQPQAQSSGENPPAPQPVQALSDAVPKIRVLMQELKQCLGNVVKGATATLAYQMSLETESSQTESAAPVNFTQSWQHFNAVCDQLECLFLSIVTSSRQNSDCQKFTQIPVFRPDLHPLESSNVPPNAMSYQQYVQLVASQTSVAHSTYEGFSEFLKSLETHKRTQVTEETPADMDSSNITQ